MFETSSTPGRMLVSRLISSPLNLKPGSAIQRNKGIGAASSSNAIVDFLMKFLKIWLLLLSFFKTTY